MQSVDRLERDIRAAWRAGYYTQLSAGQLDSLPLITVRLVPRS